MRVARDEAKRERNLEDLGLDFVDAKEVFAGPTFTFEDARFDYGEQRFVTLGVLRGHVVLLVHTETPRTIRPFPFARRRRMRKPSSSNKSRTDWSRLRATKDRDIRLTPEHPEAFPKNIVRGIVRQGLKPVPPKAAISLRVDVDVLEWFKAQGPGYQTRINAILRAYKEEAA
jgi:uncharacterized protein (DUF4415 family)